MRQADQTHKHRPFHTVTCSLKSAIAYLIRGKGNIKGKFVLSDLEWISVIDLLQKICVKENHQTNRSSHLTQDQSLLQYTSKHIITHHVKKGGRHHFLSDDFKDCSSLSFHKQAEML